MAAPPEITIKDLSGQWVMNKTLSDDTDAVLALQGIGWFTRKAISLATVTLHVKQYTAEDSIVHIDIEQTATGGIKGTSEHRTLDWTERSHTDHIFGNLTGKTRFLSLSHPELTDSFLKDGWLEDAAEGEEGERHVESFVVNSEKGWSAVQIWGFAVIEGARRYVRRVVVTKGSEVMKTRLVYDWQGKK